MNYKYKPSGVCSNGIDIDVEDGIVKGVRYNRGCNGNLQGIGRLVEGMTVDEVIEKLSGIRCENRYTSCPDQLAKALEKMKADSSC